MRYEGVSHAPGYRDITLQLRTETGAEERVNLNVQETQHLIWELASAVAALRMRPIDWERFPRAIDWPLVETWNEASEEPRS